MSLEKYKEEILVTLSFEGIKSELHDKYSQFMSIYEVATTMGIKSFENIAFQE